MKLSKSKLALAKVINENCGWPERALWAVQDNCIAFFLGGKPEYKSGGRCWHSNSIDGACVWTITCDEKVTNWHQTILSREEYYQAYPKADEDGWIEWSGGECPVSEFEAVQVKYKIDDGSGMCGTDAGELHWLHEDAGWDIIAYRLHKPDVKPEFCESVMRSIPEPEAKQTIEQLAADYRNAKDYADSKQQEADEANAAADAALGELERAGEALGLLIGIAKPEPELVITDWRDLKVGDVVEITGSSNGCWKDHSGIEMTVKDVYPDHDDNDDQVDLIGESGSWCLGGNTTWRFLRRP